MEVPKTALPGSEPLGGTSVTLALGTVPKSGIAWILWIWLLPTVFCRVSVAAPGPLSGTDRWWRCCWAHGVSLGGTRAGQSWVGPGFRWPWARALCKLTLAPKESPAPCTVFPQTDRWDLWLLQLGAAGRQQEDAEDPMPDHISCPEAGAPFWASLRVCVLGGSLLLWSVPLAGSV